MQTQNSSKDQFSSNVEPFYQSEHQPPQTEQSNFPLLPNQNLDEQTVLQDVAKYLKSNIENGAILGGMLTGYAGGWACLLTTYFCTFCSIYDKNDAACIMKSAGTVTAVPGAIVGGGVGCVTGVVSAPCAFFSQPRFCEPQCKEATDSLERMVKEIYNCRPTQQIMR